VIVAVVVAVAVSFAPEVNGVYRTRIVQELPALMTAPLTQVPPVIENVPVPVPVLAPSVGFAVSVSGPAFGALAELVTVMVAFLTVVLPVPVVIAGVGAPKATTGLVTEKFSVFVVPFADVTTATV
jgi:hypothetical protein